MHAGSAVGPRDSRWIWVITSVSQAWRIARGEGSEGVEPGLGHAENSTGDLDRVCSLSHLRDGAEPSFWGHRHLQRLVRSLGRGELGLELCDRAAGGLKLGELGAPQARALTAAD